MSLDRKEIIANLTTKWLGQGQIQLFDEIDSTNNEVKRLASEACDQGRCHARAASGACDQGAVVIADSQSAGKGRSGKSWFSTAGNGVYMSFLLKPQCQTPQITLLCAVAVRRVLAEYLEPEYGVLIKWPNDIVCCGKKLCGILLESVYQDSNIVYDAVGIGINVNNEFFPKELSNAISLFLLKGRKFSRNLIISEILNTFEYLYDIFAQQGFNGFLQEYSDFCVNIGKKAIASETGVALGTASSVNLDGSLVVRLFDGGYKTFNAGEVAVEGIY
ncbi:MAG: biotin--[acetyl-CoA-carboxylase] ligase [Clostridiales bacterium]|jgi:BirA family biotin operon repressor/biotin-[acetyl-CoA-carboxylase] ligase|nr:biotin--[acetyl-CoA-carboxylase] ligase [Clostridiales bacterium]